MKTPKDLSKGQKKQLATDLEKEKEKIVADKVNALHEKKFEDKKQEIARAVEQEEENRRTRLQKAFRSEPGLIRFIYNLKSLLTRVPADELYHESLLSDLRSKIRRSSRGIILASNDMLSGKFIAKLYSAYLQASELYDILRVIFKYQKTIDLYTRYAFKNMYKDIEIKRNLSDFVNLEELHDKIQEGGEPLKEFLQEQRLEIRKYAKNINPKFSVSITRDLSSLYHLYLFTEFDYKKFFIALGGSVQTLKNGNFDDCPIAISLKAHLENFYHFVPMLSGLGTETNNEITRYIFACGALVHRNDEDQSLEHVVKVASKDDDGYLRKLSEFGRTWNSTICNYPFEELIRLCSLNSFYDLRPYDKPALQIKERVKKYVEHQLLYELELYIDEAREGFNADAKQNLLIDYEDSMLEYYSLDSEVNTGRFYGIPGFSHIDELNIIYNFVTKYYAKNIKKIFIYLIRTVLPKNANLRTMLMNQSMAFDNLEDRIRNFNSELSPDKTWGKSLMNIVYRLEKNDTGNLVKQIKEQLKEVDSEAEHLLGQADTTFQGAIRHLQMLVNTEHPKLRETLNTVIPDSQYTLLVGIERAVRAFNSIQALVRTYYT